MHQHTRNVLLTLTALTAVAVPLAGHALAQGKTPSTPVARAQGTQAGGDTETNDDPGSTVRGSIQLPAEAQGAEVPGAQEEAQYRALAKITPAQAQRAALVAVSGTVTSVWLENENGSLVYAVVIGSTEVKVDAGNGQVLRQEAADQEQGGEQEQDNGQEGGETGENSGN